MTTSSLTHRLACLLVVLACSVLFVQVSPSQLISFVPHADSILLDGGGDIPPGLWYSLDTTAKPVDSIRVFGYGDMYCDVIDSAHAILNCVFVVNNVSRKSEYKLIYLPDPPAFDDRIVVKRDTFTMVWPKLGYLLFVVSDSGVALDSMKVRFVIRWLAAVKETPTVGASFYLMQNFPNPFNGQTSIRYYLPDADCVSFQLYNVAGQRIRTLERTERTPGAHTLTLNMDGLPSGAYYLHVRTSSEARTIVMTLIR